MKKMSEDIIADAVREFWETGGYGVCDVVAFFYQKYERANEWEWCEELALCSGSQDYESVTFEYDFCEGETCVKDITIVPLYEITRHYAKTVLLEVQDEIH